MTTLLWHCPKCDGGNDKMDAVLSRKKFVLIGKRKVKLIAVCADCSIEMEFVGTF